MSQCTIINAHITDQVIQLSNLPRIASGSKNALQIRISCCSKWEGCGLVAVFYRKEDEAYHIPVVDGLVTVPWEVLVDEGFFWFGIMGQDDLTRTTEAIRIEVAKGALTVATATPQEPTPDIYQQVIAAYSATEVRFAERFSEVTAMQRYLESRFNAAIAVPGSNEATEFYGVSSDGYVEVWIRSNGFAAEASIRVHENAYKDDGSGYETDLFIPSTYAPLGQLTLTPDPYKFPNFHVWLTSDRQLDPDEMKYNYGPCRVHVFGVTSFDYFDVDVTYGLANPSLPELTDARIGNHGDYATAGEAMREEIDYIEGVINQTTEERLMPLEETVGNVVADVADHEDRLDVLEKNGGGGGVVVSTPTYPYAIGDAEGRVVFYIDENGESHYVGQNAPTAAKPLKQNGNYDAEINMFICYGQSWSTGYDASAITTTPRYDNLMLDTGIMNNPLNDLTAVATSFTPAVERSGKSSASGQTVGETPVTAQMHIVKQLMESEDGLTVNDLSYQLLGTAPGVGSATLAKLKKGTDYYARLINQVQQAHDIATAMGKRLVVQAFSWVQGSLGEAGTYAAALEQLRLDIDTDVKAITGQTQDVKCITWQSFIYDGMPTAKQVYDQYVGAAETYPHIICAGATYHLDTKGPNPNTGVGNLHFTSVSQDWLGAYFGVAYKRTIIDGEDFEPLKPTKASKSGKILYVKFNVPQRPLVFDTERLTEAPNKGFKLYATDGTEKAITEVAIISPDTVKIVCADDVASTDRLTYGKITDDAFQWASDNHGNLRDSQGDHIQYTTDAYEYWGVSETGSYILIPAPSQVLPLHNWCVIFDKTIAELEG